MGELAGGSGLGVLGMIRFESYIGYRTWGHGQDLGFSVPYPLLLT